MKRIAIINQKGGTGKTTTTVNLGPALSEMGKSVLLVDMDPQANLTYSFGLHQRGLSVADFLQGHSSYPETAEDTGFLHLLPSSPELADLELDMAQWPERNMVLKKRLAELQGFTYDYCLIDCPPSRSLLAQNVLQAVDYVLIPMQLEVLSLEGLNQLLALVETQQSTNPGLKVLGVLPTMFNPSRKVTHEILEHLQKNQAVHIFQEQIRIDVRIVEAPSFGKSVLHYAPQSAGAEDYRAFAKAFLERVESLAKLSE